MDYSDDIRLALHLCMAWHSIAMRDDDVIEEEKFVLLV
jgi:hypothetical protein